MKIMKNNKFLFIYGFIIIIVLIVMFVADDKYFINQKKEANKIEKILNNNPSYEEQLKALLNKEYDYHYSLNYNGLTYKCQGSKRKEEEKGTCSEPESIEYNNDNYQETFKNINIDYLDVEYIFKIIKDIEPEITRLNIQKYYTYNVNILNVEGQIKIHSDSKQITQITIANGFLTYVLYFDSIK